MDYEHRFNLIASATWKSFRIMLSGTADVFTVLLWGPVTGGKAFLTNFLKGLLPSNGVPTLNAVVGIAESLVTGQFFKYDLGDWGNWLFEYAIPFVGTYRLIEGSIDLEPTITEVKETLSPKYGDIIASSAETDGIFFSSN